MKLPTWQEIGNKIQQGVELNPLERFLCDNERGRTTKEKQWRNDFKKALVYFIENRHSKKRFIVEAQDGGHFVE